MCQIKSNTQHRKPRNTAKIDSSKYIKPVELSRSILVIISLTSIVAIEYPWIMAKAYQPSDFLPSDQPNQSHSKSFEDMRSVSKSRARRFDRQLSPEEPRNETNRDPIKTIKATKRTRPANPANFAGSECKNAAKKTFNSSAIGYQYKVKRFKRGFRSRPKLRTKIFGKITPILKKPTPTKVIIGAHLGTLAYRKYTNWTSASKTSNQSVALNGTQILANGTALANNTWLAPVDVRPNSTRLVALNGVSNSAIINLEAGNETVTPAATNVTLDDEANNGSNNNDDDDEDDVDDKQPKTLTLVEIVPLTESNTYTTTMTNATSAAKSPIKRNVSNPTRV